MSAYKTYSTKQTPQSQPVPGTDQVKNSAGGYVFQIDDWKRLERFLILGSDSPTYYASAQNLTKENADIVVKLLGQDGKRVVDTIVEVSTSGRAAKNDAAIFALAMASGLGDDKTKTYALDNMHRVCRIGTHLFSFVDYVQQFRGWGRGLRRAVNNWYNKKSADQLAYQVVKYQQRGNWSHRDVLRLGKPVPEDDDHDVIFEWITKGLSDQRYALEDIPMTIAGYESVKLAKTKYEVAKLIEDYRLTREMVPTEWLNEPEVWDALLKEMPLTAMIRNLGKMSAIGLVKPMSAASVLVCKMLRDTERIRNARIHPVNVLVALKTYASGHGIRGKLNWTPVAQVVDALDDAFYAAFDNVEPTGKRFMLALDASGSMGFSYNSFNGVTARELAAAMSMTTARTEKLYQTVAFTSDRRDFSYGGNSVVPLNLSPRQRLDDIVRVTSGLPFGGTDCALPMLYAQKNNIEIDVFIIYTDNETWAGHIHPFQALNRYRQSTGIPAKLIVAAFTSTGFSIADPGDPGMLDIVGMDSAIPTLIHDFSKS